MIISLTFVYFQEIHLTMNFLHQVFTSVSIFSTVAIAFDRHSTIVGCFEHSRSNSKSYVIKGLTLIYLTSLVLNSSIFWLPMTTERESQLCVIFITYFRCHFNDVY